MAKEHLLGLMEKSITIRTTSKPYSGFQGVVVTPKAKQYPEGAEGAAMELLDNWDELSSRDAAKAQQKLESLLREMSYEELRDIYEATANPVVEGAMYQSWLTTMRSGENGLRVSRTSGTETEPNDDMSTATALAADTVSAYITAFDEDWYFSSELAKTVFGWGNLGRLATIHEKLNKYGEIKQKSSRTLPFNWTRIEGNINYNNLSTFQIVHLLQPLNHF